MICFLRFPSFRSLASLSGPRSRVARPPAPRRACRPARRSGAARALRSRSRVRGARHGARGRRGGRRGWPGSRSKVARDRNRQQVPYTVWCATDFRAHLIRLNNCADDGRSATGNTQTPRADAHLLELFDRARGITRSLELATTTKRHDNSRSSPHCVHDVNDRAHEIQPHPPRPA